MPRQIFWLYKGDSGDIEDINLIALSAQEQQGADSWGHQQP